MWSGLRGAARCTLATARRFSSHQLPTTAQHPRAHVLEQYRQHLQSTHHDIFTQDSKTVQISPVDAQDIFITNELNMAKVDIFGFDYDYTLACYSEELSSLTYNMAVKLLVDKLMYPPEILGIPYDPTFAIRGLHYDTAKGLLMKIDAYHNVQLDTVHKGRRPLEPDIAFATYGGTHIPMDYLTHHMQSLSDLFSLPEACLLANIVEYFTSKEIGFAPAHVYWDVKSVMRQLHGDRLLHRAILENLPQYLEPNPGIGDLLNKLRNNGKITFLLTNSPFEFVIHEFMFSDRGMSAMVSPDWRDMFNVVIIEAQKPNFYRSNNQFRELDLDLSGRPKWDTVTSIRRGRVYSHGNIEDLTTLANWAGKRVIYLGDHVFTDLHEPSVKLGWRTGAIIREIADELNLMNSRNYHQHLTWLLAVQKMMKSFQLSMEASETTTEDHEFFRRLIDERKFTQKKLKLHFNQHFGSVFRTHTNPSYFAHRLCRTADLYTSNVMNLMNVSMNHLFLPNRVFLPHEPSPVRDLL